MIKLLQGDCLELMKDIKDKSIDMILCDLPYGITACKWDSVIPFEPLWKQYSRVIKDNGAIVLFGNEPFTSKLILSNLNMYKYNWYWIKDNSRAINFMHAKNMPLKHIETISVFSKGSIAHKNNKNRMMYNPQGLMPLNKKVIGNNKGGKNNEYNINRPSNKDVYIREFTNYPIDVLEFKSEIGLHPTQKPVALLEYLIKTYTNEGETVLDNCMGSGSSGIASIHTNRNFIGIELDKDYFDIAKKRIDAEQKEVTHE